MKIVLRLLAISLVAAGLAFLGLLPPIASPEPVKVEPSAISVEPLPLRASCPGPLVEVGGEQGTDLGATARIGEPVVSVHGAEFVAAEWSNFLASGSQQSTDLLSANQIQSVDRSRLAGLAGVNCGQPTNFGYFVTGDSGPGTESILILGNPNQVEVLVELELSSAAGLTTERIPLAPLQQKAISLVALSGAESVYALSFQTSGLAVSAYMQQRTVSGLAATGVALVPPQQALLNGIIPALEVPSGGFEPAELRVYNPGLEQAELILQLGDGVDFDLIRVLVPAGTIVEQDLNPAEGNSLVLFESDQPVVLAIKNQILDQGLDFSWLTPADVFSDPLRIIAPRSGLLFLANPGLQPLKLRVVGPDSTNVLVPARGQMVVEVSAGSYLVSGGEFAATLSLKNSLGYATITPTQMQNFGEELLVRVN